MSASNRRYSLQGSKVQLELEQLRQKHLAKNQRDKFKDLNSPLTTPEEAQAFLAAMRDKSHQREITHRPPSNISADGIDAWYRQQKEREMELRKRRKEAEALLRGYRGYSTRNSNLNTPTGIFSFSSEHFEDATPAKEFDLEIDLSEESRDPMEENEVGFRVKKGTYKQRKKITGEEKKEDDTIPKARSYDSTGSGRQEEPMAETVWRFFISNEPGSRFPPEPGRYHLYCSYACPGSHRALIVRKLKGLEHIIGVTYVHPTWRLTNPEDPDDKHRGWVFGDPYGQPFQNTINRGGPFPSAYPETEPDPEFDAFSIRELYEAANDTSGKFTIPLLWDTKEKTIVNNDSSDIAYMLNSCFNELTENGEMDLYTEDDEEGRAKLSEVNAWLSPLMINGVYRCGFAKNQRAYDRAIDNLCLAFDHADDILQRQRFLTGDTLTDADIRLFVTLFRFDEVYAFYFKANARLVMLTPTLLNFCREIYQMEGIAETCNMDHIKAHFFASHPEWNKYSVIPRGLGFCELLEMPHNRSEMFGDEDLSF